MKPLVCVSLYAVCALIFAAPALATKPLPANPVNGPGDVISSGDADTTTLDDQDSADTSVADDGDATAGDLGAPAVGSGGTTISSGDADTTTLGGDDDGDVPADNGDSGTGDDCLGFCAAALRDDVWLSAVLALRGRSVGFPWKHLATL